MATQTSTYCKPNFHLVGLGYVRAIISDGKNPETANIYTAINTAEIQNIIELEAVMLLQNLVLIKPVNYEKL